MSAEELKVLLSTPAALFLVMLLGSLASMLKQISDANKNGAVTSLGSYLAHWPETAGTVITNALGFLTLVVTDQLNFASALGIGYAANSAADLLRSGGRSAALSVKQGGFARAGLLLSLAIVSAVILTGCATNIDRQLATGARIHATATRSVTGALDAHMIGSKDAEAYNALAVNSSAILDSARDLKDIDPKTAEGKVQLANGILKELQDFLVKYLEKQP